MKTLTWIDKASWPAGPWKREPDKAEWADEKTGLPCLIVRHRHSGHLCGYVGVPEGHPSFGKDYDDIAVEVHGGLTYSSLCDEDEKERGVCHTADKAAYWLGFDCAHAGDHAYFTERIDQFPGEVYRDFGYVQRECAHLAAQLITLD